jgi:hypothetical protein
MLLTARADAQGAQPGTVLADAVRSFAYLPPDVRQIHLFEYHWNELPSQDWVEYPLNNIARETASLARVGVWSRQQVILAALSWFLVAW